MKFLNKQIIALSMICGSVAMQSVQAEESFKPSGKPEMRIYTNFHTTSMNGNSVNMFEGTRAYLGYEHNFSENFSGRVTYDVGKSDATGSKLDYTGFVKYGYLRYKKEKLSIDFGLVETKQYKEQETNWGYRYLLKSFMDEYKIGPSADFGTTVTYKFSNMIEADFSIHNGEGYKSLEKDSFILVGAGLIVNPIKGLKLRASYDQMNTKFDPQQTVALFAGYTAEKFTIGAEWIAQYNHRFEHNANSGNDLFGTSVYGTYQISKKSKAYLRYDDLSSANSWNIKKDGQLYVAGYELYPVKGIKLSPNFRFWNSNEKDEKNCTSVFLNVEVKF